MFFTRQSSAAAVAPDMGSRSLPPAALALQSSLNEGEVPTAECLRQLKAVHRPGVAAFPALDSQTRLEAGEIGRVSDMLGRHFRPLDEKETIREHGQN